MSDTISRIFAVLEAIRRERAIGDRRSNKQVRIDVVRRIAEERDVRPAAVLEPIVEVLSPEIGSVSALERALDSWLNGRSDLQRALKKHAIDQQDDRAVVEFFKLPTGGKGETGAAKESVAAAPLYEMVEEPLAAGGDDDGAHEEAEARAMAEAASQAAAEEERAKAEAEELARSQAEARSRAEAAAQAAVAARVKADAAARAAADARARKEAAAKAKAEAAERARAEQEARERAEAEERERAEAAERERAEAAERQRAEAEEQEREAAEAASGDGGPRTITLDEDVARYFADERAVNDFLRAAVAAMRVAQRDSDE
jgi:hypothetical protein